MKKKKHITRRAPHMEKFTPISRSPYTGVYTLNLVVGVQSFAVGFPREYETRKHAEWHRDMLCIALDAMVKECLETGLVAARDAGRK